MAAVLLLAGSFVYLRVASDLSSSIDDALRTRFDDVAAQLRETRPDRIGVGGPSVEGSEDVLTEVIDPAGELVAGSEGAGATSVLDPDELEAARAGLEYFDPGHVEGIEHDARLLAGPVANSGGTYVVVAGASTGDRAETLSGLLATFAVGGPIALLLASAIGYGLAGLAMRPVEAMRARAGRITLDRSGERLPLPASDDEIRRLGVTLNEMLERIEGLLSRERSFVADASHELRTPLAVLRSEIELALRLDRGPDEIRAAMLSAAEEVERLQALTDDLLALARADDGRLALERREARVDELLERVRSRYATRAREEGREIGVDRIAGLEFDLDPERVERAVSNLVENALRHGVGRVQLGAGLEPDCRALTIAVTDEGDGFAPDFAPVAFDRFARAERGRTTPGSGLGLAIVRAIAEAHGGEATIVPVRGATRVEIRIPAPAPA